VASAGPRPAPKLPRPFAWAFAGSALALTATGWLWKGIDFAAGVTLGSLVVGLNVAWTRTVVLGALRGERGKARVALTYLAKFGLTVLVLALAILRFGIDPLAILVGVSSLLLAVTVVVVVRYAV
jgi:hypothetical protein